MIAIECVENFDTLPMKREPHVLSSEEVLSPKKSNKRVPSREPSPARSESSFAEADFGALSLGGVPVSSPPIMEVSLKQFI